MKTIHIGDEEMTPRISRFNKLQPLKAAESLDIPMEAKDIIYSRKLLSVIGLGDQTDTPINQSAPIQGAGGMTMTFAVCPPGTGPSLHAHHQTYETFTVLTGRFEFRWNDNGENRVELDPYDTISIPPRVCRGFRNISDEDAMVQVIITGGVHDMNDIDYPATTARELETFGPGVVEAFVERGMTFTAGVSEVD